MKNLITRTLQICVAILSLLCFSWANAEGTKEVISDTGLYSGNPPGSLRTELLTWCGGQQCTYNGTNPAPDVPEGRTDILANVPNTWGGYGIFFVAPNTTPIVVLESDCSEYTGGAVRFLLKSSSQLLVELEFYARTGGIGKGSYLVPSTANKWEEIVIPLSSFNPAPNLARMRGLFLITATNPTGIKTWQVDHVRWTKPIVALQILPQTAVLNRGQECQFTTVGLTASNEVVHIYPRYYVEPGVGTLNSGQAGPSVTAVFRATNCLNKSGYLVVTNTLGNQSAGSLTATALVEVTRAPRDRNVGVASQSLPDPEFLIELLSYFGAGAMPPNLETDTNQSCEGDRSLKFTIDHTTNTAFSGWTAFYGAPNSTDDYVLDMSGFYSGTISFCFKGDPQLQGHLLVGIRSGNVAPGSAYSQVPLTNYVACDGRWHTVAIPCRVFAGARPWCDLARVKEFFSIVAVGHVDELASFWIDDLRWRVATPRFTGIDLLEGCLLRLSVTAGWQSPCVVYASPDLTNWVPIHTNAACCSDFTLFETNCMRSLRFFEAINQ